MNCPDVGTWRAWLDDGRAAELEGHRAACASCRAVVDELEAHAAHAERALGALAPSAVPSGAALRLARARLDAAVGAVPAASSAPDRPEPVAPRAVRPVGGYAEAVARPRGGAFARWRLAAAGMAAALLVGAVATVPAAQTAAAGFLAQFRSQRFVAVPVDAGQASNVFGRLKELGVVQEPRERRPERVGSAAEASARVGFPVVLPAPSTLPAGLSATPTYEVSPATELRFTYQHARAREYVRRVGRPDFPLSERFDGATLVVNVPAGVLLHYRGSDPNRNLLIGQAGEVTAGVEGKVGIDELRDYVLGFPGLPDETVRVLRGVPDWHSVMPIPVPLDRVSGQSVNVGGVSGLMLADNTGLGTGVIFNRGGRLYGVAGNYRSNEVLAVANGL